MIQVRCRCGTVQGEVDPARPYARVTCYCRDCRAYAQWLGAPGLLDAAGGTDIVATAPSRPVPRQTAFALRIMEVSLG